MTSEQGQERSDFDAAPIELATILSIDWLQRTLPRLGDGHLVDVTVLEQIQGSSTKVRLRATEAGDQDGTTARQYCVKGLFDDRARRSPIVDAEVLFYQSDLRHQLRTAIPVYTGLRKDRGVLIMEDLVETRGARFAQGPGAWSPDQVASGLDEIARLHAGTWGRQPDALAVEWLVPKTERLLQHIGAERLQAFMDAEDSAPLAVRDASRLRQAFQRTSQYFQSKQATCVAHGDLHAGNVFVESDGSMGVLDWSLVHYGYWAVDVAYLIGSAFSPQTRAAHERDLVNGYRDALRDHGGPALSAEECWSAYRLGLIHGYYLWAITQGIEAPTRRENVRRLSSAVLDHDSLALAEAELT